MIWRARVKKKACLITLKQQLACAGICLTICAVR